MHRKLLPRVGVVIALLILVALMIYGGLRIMESAVFSNEQQEIIASKTIIRDGVKYYPRKDLCTVLIMGVDKEGVVAESAEPNHGNAVDMIALMVFDPKDQAVDLLCLNRDTMVEMPKLNEYGRQTGTRIAQLAISHTYGRGMEDSCNNTKTTVSNLLRGITIDYYVAMNLDAVSILNDAVGGVTVNVTDDFSEVDSSIKKGIMTLYGDQAVAYVQSRKNVANQLNLSRMERQKEYMRGFVQAIRNKAEESENAIISAYTDAQPYMVTDITVPIIMRLSEDYGEYELRDVLSLKGENVRGKNHYEYYVDEDALEELVLERFFEVKQ